MHKPIQSLILTSILQFDEYTIVQALVQQALSEQILYIHIKLFICISVWYTFQKMVLHVFLIIYWILVFVLLFSPYSLRILVEVLGSCSPFFFSVLQMKRLSRTSVTKGTRLTNTATKVVICNDDEVVHVHSGPEDRGGKVRCTYGGRKWACSSGKWISTTHTSHKELAQYSTKVCDQDHYLNPLFKHQNIKIYMR